MLQNGFTKQTAIAAAQKLMDTIPVGASSTSDAEFLAWKQRASALLAAMLGEEHNSVRSFSFIQWHSMVPGVVYRDGSTWPSASERSAFASGALRHGFNEARGVLEGVLGVLQFLPDSSVSVNTDENGSIDHDRVFVVHGHDGALKNAVARYIRILGLKEVILHEQPDRGRTIIEKFEQEAKCAFAVVLATKDDLAASAKQMRDRESNAAQELLQARARQNVIFELGFFVGRLGRGKVMLISDADLELPSDLAGVIWSSRADWTTKLAGELNAAGFRLEREQIFEAAAIRE